MSLRLRLRTPVLLALELVAITTLTVAAARPQRVTIIEQPNLARNIMLVIDASNSMSGEDFPTKFGTTSRMEGVKTVVAEYVRSRRGDRVGLVVFGNTSYLQSPLTNDTLLVEKLVEQLQPRMAGDGTAIGDGLGLALKRLRDVEARSKAIILMTDGVNTAGQVSPLKAAQIAKDLGIQIHTIGIGTGTVTLGQDPFGGLLGTTAGPKAEFDEATLKEIAKMTGGVYYPQANGKFERFNRTIKTECIRPKAPISLADAKRIVADFIEAYNSKRLHSSLGFVTPYDRLVGRHEEIFQARDAKLEAARARRKAVREHGLLAA